MAGEHEISGPDGPVESRQGTVPLFGTSVAAGFPSPADDYVERALDLNEHLIEHPAATYCVRASGNSMIGGGIHDGDLLIVDRAVEPRDGCIAIAVVDGELTVKRIRRQGERILLMPDNRNYPAIEVGAEADFLVWGVCRFVIHAL
jgi:DNA polymerase V